MRTAVTFLIIGALCCPAAWAGYDEAIAAYERQDYVRALTEFLPLARQGDALAQHDLGVMYENGRGTPKNDSEALSWYRKAAEQGFPPAQYNLGVMYEHGQGTPKNAPKALIWYRKAAEQGYTGAQTILGNMYEKGQGTPKNYTEALTWYRKAAKEGNALAQLLLGRMYFLGQGTPKNYSEALTWYRKAAEQQHPDALWYLGLMYKHGIAVRSSLVVAYALYNLAAANNYEPAEGDRDEIESHLTKPQRQEAQALSIALAKPNMLLKELDNYISKLPAEVNKMSSPQKISTAATASNDGFPPRPEKQPGVISCSTSCVNAICLRTYDDGRKVRFTARQVFDPVSNSWKINSGMC